MKMLYTVLAFLGALLPLSQLLLWLMENGLNIPLLFQHAFESKIAAFAWLDVIISAVVLLVFIQYEGRRINMKMLWLPSVGTCTVGVSLGLPLFLLMREIKLKKLN